jgi:rare lipoprotein A
MYAMTAAHRSLPLPTYVSVTNLENDKSAVVRVNDRGPFHEGRIIDLSYAAAVKLGITSNGTARVEVRALAVNGTNSESMSSLKVDPMKQTETAQNKHATTIRATTLSSVSTPISHFLQVGAFLQRQNAERLVARLQSSASAPVTISNNDEFYRVRIGPFAALEQAQRVEAALLEQGFSDTHIVVVD